MLYGMFGCFVNLCAVLFYLNVVSLVLLILSAPKSGVPCLEKSIFGNLLVHIKRLSFSTHIYTYIYISVLFLLDKQFVFIHYRPIVQFLNRAKYIEEEKKIIGLTAHC